MSRAINQIPDHRFEAQLHAIVRVVNPLDAVLHQLRDFFRRNRAATAAEYLDMFCAELTQPIDHVGEELHMTALVRTDRDAVGIFLDSRPHDVVDAAVVAEVDNLDALGLYQAAHDVDRRIVAVEQGCRRNEAQRGGIPLDGGAGHVVSCHAHSSTPARNHSDIVRDIRGKSLNIN